MRRQDFAYSLPAELIAQRPLAQRSASRLLLLDGMSGASGDHAMRELPQLLQPHDLLVLNDTRVVPARLIGHKPSGGRVEILLERALEGTEALAQVSASKPIRAGLEIRTAGGVVTVLSRESEHWHIRLPAAALEFFERFGAVPLPPYIHRSAQEEDRERYQSIFAREAGAVAAPTASLHFDAALTQALSARQVARAFVTLHVGAGTFQPIRVEDIGDHVMHAERVRVPAATCAAIARARSCGGRVVAVGTTVVRALESAAVRCFPVTARAGWTDHVVTPQAPVRVVDGLLTGLHEPRSSHLRMLAAFHSEDLLERCYDEALAEGYLWHEFGDVHLLLP